jgi:flagellar basal body P-ring formation protein FlgA
MIPLLMLAAAVFGCHPVAGGRIMGSDLAAASPAFRSAPPDLVAGYAPQPGLRRFLNAAELARIARANHIDAADFTPLCFERATAPPDPETVAAAMRKVLDAPDARIEILALSKFPAPRGEMVLPRASLVEPQTGDSTVWNGYIQYDGGRFPVWARVRLSVRQHRLIAAADLAPGLPVKTDSVRVEDCFDFPRRIPPLSSPEAAVGRVPRHVIPAGRPVTAADLQDPNEVNPGETVEVEVRSGTAVLKLEAKAVSAGRRGDTIAVRNASSGKLFRAQVEEKGRVLVQCRPQGTCE